MKFGTNTHESTLSKKKKRQPRKNQRWLPFFKMDALYTDNYFASGNYCK